MFSPRPQTLHGILVEASAQTIEQLADLIELLRSAVEAIELCDGRGGEILGAHAECTHRRGQHEIMQALAREPQKLYRRARGYRHADGQSAGGMIGMLELEGEALYGAIARPQVALKFQQQPLQREQQHAGLVQLLTELAARPIARWQMPGRSRITDLGAKTPQIQTHLGSKAPRECDGRKCQHFSDGAQSRRTQCRENRYREF